MKIQLLTSTFLSICTASLSEAYAACTLSPSNAETIDVSMDMGNLVVTPSMPVGYLIKEGKFNYTSGSSQVICDKNGGKNIAELSKPLKLSSLGSKIYSTNIPGIGIKLYRTTTGGNASGFYPYTVDLDSGPHSLGDGHFHVQIYKTNAVTGSGSLTPGQYSRYYNQGHPNRPRLTSTIYGNAITIASSSCEIQGNINKIITLPTVTKDKFKGIGTTTGEQAFNFKILCNGGVNPTNVQVSNKISLSYDFIANPDLKSIINSAPTNSKANGVSIQLINKYNNANAVITKNATFNIGTVNSNQTINYNMPLTARYIQTAQTVTSGHVQGVATVTIKYD